VRKTHSPEVISYALSTIKANGGNLKAAERDLRAQGYVVARSTLRAWDQGKIPKAAAEQVAESGTRSKASVAVAKRFREIQSLYFDRAQQPEVVAKTSGKDALIIIAIADDKATRAEGGPTSITENRVTRYVDPEALRRLAGAVDDDPRISLPERTPTT
jgi:hypothetical protein